MSRRPVLIFTTLLFAFLAGAIGPHRERYPRTPLLTLQTALLRGECTWLASSDPTEASSASAGLGGDLSPLRYVLDPYPTFNGIALDVENNRVVLSDENGKRVLTYSRTSGSLSTGVTKPSRQIIGPATGIGYISGIEVDPQRHELYAVNNDIEDRIVVFDYDVEGDVKAKRHLYVPHQTWGVSLNQAQDQIAISVQQLNVIAFYRRGAEGLEAPLRIIQGPDTGMADPHGIRWDVVHHEVAAANHGNYSVINAYSAYDVAGTQTPMPSGGQFQLPSITFYSDFAQGDAKPLRTIQGERTTLNWPMGIDIDASHNEIAVANNGNHSVLVFSRTANGNIAPIRVIQGSHTGIDSPMGIAIDTKNDEIWVANYGDHTALVFPRTASGDITPQRILRNAPAGTPTGGFGNPYAVAYDSKRDELLVPN